MENQNDKVQELLKAVIDNLGEGPSMIAALVAICRIQAEQIKELQNLVQNLVKTTYEGEDCTVAQMERLQSNIWEMRNKR